MPATFQDQNEDFTKKLGEQKAELEQAIERQLSFVDQLLADKEELAKKCEILAEELENAKTKFTKERKLQRENFQRDMQSAKESWSASRTMGTTRPFLVETATPIL